MQCSSLKTVESNADWYRYQDSTFFRNTYTYFSIVCIYIFLNPASIITINDDYQQINFWCLCFASCLQITRILVSSKNIWIFSYHAVCSYKREKSPKTLLPSLCFVWAQSHRNLNMITAGGLRGSIARPMNWKCAQDIIHAWHGFL